MAEFGALATGIVIERERAAAKQRSELQALSRRQELSAEVVGPGEFQPLLARILAAAADISGTDKGNIQLYDRAADTLRIIAYQGLGAEPHRAALSEGLPCQPRLGTKNPRNGGCGSCCQPARA